MQEILLPNFMVNQTVFLRGLLQVINVLKSAHWYPLPADTDEPNLFNRHLPKGVCKGYAATASMAALGKNVRIGTGWNTSYTHNYGSYWREICRMAHRSTEELQRWTEHNQSYTKHLVIFAEHILRYHYHDLHQSLDAHDSYLDSDTGATTEVMLTINLPFHEHHKNIENEVLVKFLTRNFLDNGIFTANKTLTISDGKHRIAITRDELQLTFALHDANHLIEGIDTLHGLVQAIIQALDIHQLHADHIAMKISLSSYNPQDNEFNSILHALREIELDKPVVDALADPSQKPVHQLLKEWQSHSRVGLLRDLLLFKSDVLGSDLRSKMQDYLSCYPDALRIIEQYNNFLNEPSCSGHSWLHMQMLTGENYAWHKMLEMGAKPDDGVDPTKRFKPRLHDVIPDSEYQPVRRGHLVGSGIKGLWNKIGDNKETKLDEFEYYLSYPIHFAVVTNNLYALTKLVQAGANVNRTTQRGETPLYLAIICEFHQIAEYLRGLGAEEEVENNFPPERPLINFSLDSTIKLKSGIFVDTSTLVENVNIALLGTDRKLAGSIMTALFRDGRFSSMFFRNFSPVPVLDINAAKRILNMGDAAEQTEESVFKETF
ncbi:MAG: ankyrin repeat domain-containing protein [Pseudomonadota bacterium]|nr:ankyrin repeat domain-containing protein [Pseudomonadota bacterium]